MNKSLLMIILLCGAGFGTVAFLALGSPPDTQKVIAESLDVVQAEQKAALATPPKKQSIGDIPILSEAGPWPKVVAENLSYSFGRMQVKSTKSHTFTIRNEGEADLQLVAGTTTCKCTQFGFGSARDGELKSAVVKPGESTELIMSWKAGDVPDKGFRHGGAIHTNDPDRPVLNYAVEGAIEESFEVLPAMWKIDSMSPNEPGRFKGAIATRLFDSFEIESVTSPSGLVKVTPVLMAPEEKAQERFEYGYALHAEVSPEIPAGKFEEELQIKISGRDEPIRVTIQAIKHGAIRLQQMAGTQFNPETLILKLGSFLKSQGREAKLLLIVDEKDMPEPFRLTATEADPTFLKATLTPLGEPTGTVHRYVLAIAVPPGRPHVQRVESNPGSLRISTNLPTGEEISMSVLLYSN